MSQEKSSFKPAMLAHLQKQGITEISELWAEAKNYANDNRYIMGGCYLSFGKDISVSLLKNDTHEKFKITLKEVKQNKK